MEATWCGPPQARGTDCNLWQDSFGSKAPSDQAGCAFASQAGVDVEASLPVG